MKKFYQFSKNDKGNVLSIFGDITTFKFFEDDVCVYDFEKELSEMQGDILVRINSYGGDVDAGLAIHNLLVEHDGKVTTDCVGVACSAASVIFMAGDERIMHMASLLLIHNVWTSANGDSKDFKKIADDLEKLTKPSIEIYRNRSNLSEEKIKEMMDDETWITPDEALSYGFATSIKTAEVKQSLDNHFLSRLVRENKELKTELKNKNNIVDPWESFFNGGK